MASDCRWTRRRSLGNWKLSTRRSSHQRVLLTWVRIEIKGSGSVFYRSDAFCRLVLWAIHKRRYRIRLYEISRIHLIQIHQTGRIGRISVEQHPILLGVRLTIIWPRGSTRVNADPNAISAVPPLRNRPHIALLKVPRCMRRIRSRSGLAGQPKVLRPIAQSTRNRQHSLATCSATPIPSHIALLETNIAFHSQLFSCACVHTFFRKLSFTDRQDEVCGLVPDIVDQRRYRIHLHQVGWVRLEHLLQTSWIGRSSLQPRPIFVGDRMTGMRQ